MRALILILIAQSGFASEPDFYVEVQEFLLKYKPAEVENFLESWAGAGKTFPFVTYMSESNSLQGASLRYPRAISIARDGKSVMAFSGHESLKHSNAVEFYQFIESGKRFEFFEVIFDKGAGELSKRNPQLCLTCHGKDPRPIWEPYPVWTGAFAAERFFPPGPVLSREETLFFATYKNQTPRYQGLPDPTEEKFRGIAEDVSSQNIAFNHFAYAMNFERLSRIAAVTPFFKEYKYALIGRLICQSDEPAEDSIRRYLPEVLAQYHLERFLPDLHRRDHSETTALFLSYLFDVRDISTKLWGTHLRDVDRRTINRFAVTDASERDSTYLFAYPFLRDDPDFNGLDLKEEIRSLAVGRLKFPYLVPRERTTFCQLMEERSREALERLLETFTPEEIFSAQTRL